MPRRRDRGITRARGSRVGKTTVGTRSIRDCDHESSRSSGGRSRRRTRRRNRWTDPGPSALGGDGYVPYPGPDSGMIEEKGERCIAATVTASGDTVLLGVAGLIEKTNEKITARREVRTDSANCGCVPERGGTSWSSHRRRPRSSSGEVPRRGRDPPCGSVILPRPSPTWPSGSRMTKGVAAPSRSSRGLQPDRPAGRGEDCPSRDKLVDWRSASC
jgi:hypothetical protein